MVSPSQLTFVPDKITSPSEDTRTVTGRIEGGTLVTMTSYLPKHPGTGRDASAEMQIKFANGSKVEIELSQPAYRDGREGFITFYNNDAHSVTRLDDTKPEVKEGFYDLGTKMIIALQGKQLDNQTLHALYNQATHNLAPLAKNYAVTDVSTNKGHFAYVWGVNQDGQPVVVSRIQDPLHTQHGREVTKEREIGVVYHDGHDLDAETVKLTVKSLPNGKLAVTTGNGYDGTPKIVNNPDLTARFNTRVDDMLNKGLVSPDEIKEATRLAYQAHVEAPEVPAVPNNKPQTRGK